MYNPHLTCVCTCIVSLPRADCLPVRSVMMKLKNGSSRVAGVAVVAPNTNPPQAFSPHTTCPNENSGGWLWACWDLSLSVTRLSEIDCGWCLSNNYNLWWIQLFLQSVFRNHKDSNMYFIIYFNQVCIQRAMIQLWPTVTWQCGTPKEMDWHMRSLTFPYFPWKTTMTLRSSDR